MQEHVEEAWVQEAEGLFSSCLGCKVDRGSSHESLFSRLAHLPGYKQTPCSALTSYVALGRCRAELTWKRTCMWAGDEVLLDNIILICKRHLGAHCLFTYDP